MRLWSKVAPSGGSVLGDELRDQPHGEVRGRVLKRGFRSDMLGEIRKQLNAISYVKKLLSQV